MTGGHAPDRVRLELAGEVDMAAAPQLVTTIDRLIREGNTHFEINFSRVAFLDSSALGALVSTRRRLSGETDALVLTGLSANLRKIFEVTGLERYFTFA